MNLNIALVEDYPHPIEKVWRSLTDPAALKVWLMDTDFEPRVGKHFFFQRKQGRVQCEVLELDPPHKMVWSWIHIEGDPPSRVEFQLEPINTGTRLKFSHTGEIDDVIGAGVTQGWPEKLANLQTQLRAA